MQQAWRSRARPAFPAHVVSHAEYGSREAFEEALARAIDVYAPALVVLAGFMRVLTPGFVRRYEGRLVNIHPSLLPLFPGLQTHRQALAAGVRIHGATVHFVSNEVDSGAIIAQAAVPVQPGDDEPTLAERVLVEEHRLLPRRRSTGARRPCALRARACRARRRRADELSLLAP